MTQKKEEKYTKKPGGKTESRRAKIRKKKIMQKGNKLHTP